MNASGGQSETAPATDFTRSWRYKVELTMIIVGNSGILIAMLLPFFGVGTSIVGALVVIGEIISLASIVFLGKAGFTAIKSKFTSSIKASYTKPVGKVRHYIGIGLFGVYVLNTFIIFFYDIHSLDWVTYEPIPVVWGLNSAQQTKMVLWLCISGAGALLISIYVLGADWWGRFRRIFIWYKPEITTFDKQPNEQ